MRDTYKGRRLTVMVLLMGCAVFVLMSGPAGLPMTGWGGKAFAQFIQGDPFVRKVKVEKVLTLEERQPIYMKAEGFVPIGMLEAGQPVALTGEDEQYYEIRFGKMAAFIPKGHGTIAASKLSVSTHSERLAAVKTVQKTRVFERANMQSDPVAELAEGFRYPVVHETDDWYVIKIGERPGYIHKPSVVRDEGLPVLVYHHILPREMMTTTASTVSLESFELQMKYLADEGFTALTADELYDYLEGRIVVTSRAVLLTFDDGLLSSKEYAYPLLKQYGFTALQHIISSRTDRANGEQVFNGEGPLQFLTREEMKEMRDVFQYEAHTHELHTLEETKDGSHAGVALSLSEEAIREDLQQNKAAVPSAITVAYPFGHYTEAFVEAAKKSGLLIGFTTVEGYANMELSNYDVCRFGMTEKKTFEEFAAYVDGKMTWQ